MRALLLSFVGGERREPLRGRGGTLKGRDQLAVVRRALNARHRSVNRRERLLNLGDEIALGRLGGDGRIGGILPHVGARVLLVHSRAPVQPGVRLARPVVLEAPRSGALCEGTDKMPIRWRKVLIQSDI